MNPNRYYTKHFHLQYLSAVVQLVPSFIPIPAQALTFFFLLLILLKHRVQGFRLNIFALIACHLAYVLELPLLHSVLLAIFTYSIYKFRVYEVPRSKGNLGYRRFHIGLAEFEMFYPTDEKKDVTELPLFERGVWNIMFDIVNKDTEHPSKLPLWVMYLGTHYYTKMMMQDIIHNARPRPSTYQVLVLSHQLGLNSLYTYARQFADNGFLVVSLFHHEQIRNRYPGIQPNYQMRVDQLNARTQDVQHALEFLHDKVRLEGMFGTGMKIDYQKIHMLGHSFGGSTCVNTAFRDQRITGVVVAMDPCLYVLDNQVTYEKNQHGYSKKTMILLAEDYYDSHYPSFQNDYRTSVLRDNSKPGSVLAYRFMGSNHASFSEMALIAQGQFRTFNVLRDNDKTRFFLQLTIFMIRLLLANPETISQQDFMKLAITQNPQFERQIFQVVRVVNKQEQEARHRNYMQKTKTQ